MTGNCSSGTGAPLYIDITILDTDSVPDSPEENCFRELILLSLILARELFKELMEYYIGFLICRKRAV